MQIVDADDTIVFYMDGQSIEASSWSVVEQTLHVANKRSIFPDIPLVVDT
jgi:hypothetical protein